jgi:hypothetical protein
MAGPVVLSQVYSSGGCLIHPGVMGYFTTLDVERTPSSNHLNVKSHVLVRTLQFLHMLRA